MVPVGERYEGFDVFRQVLCKALSQLTDDPKKMLKDATQEFLTKNNRMQLRNDSDSLAVALLNAIDDGTDQTVLQKE